MGSRLLHLVLLAALSLFACAAWGAPDVDLLARSDWKLNGVTVTPGAAGYRVAVNRNVSYGWAEIRLPVDVAATPVIRVQVEGANPKAKWTLKVQFPPRQEEWLITDNDQNGTFSFPIGEYLERYDKGDCIVRFFAIGNGAAVTLKRLDLLGSGAEGVVERVTVDEDQPRQQIDGAGGQTDYPLWTVGKQFDRVSSQEIHTVLSDLQFAGVTIGRVGAYGDVIQAATSNPEDTRLKALVHHIKALKQKGIRTMFVAWFPATETMAKPAKTDAWRDSCVATYAQLLSYCAAHGAPISYFELQNEPHSNKGIWSPDFLGQCALALAKECDKRSLSVEMIGPDGMDDEWVAGWVKQMGDRARIVALKSGADKRGTREMTAHQVAAAIARCQAASPIPRRYWLTEYGCWAWGNPDEDRRGENGPADGIRYGTAMAELTHYYLAAGISCPSIWEAYDVRRIDEVAGKPTPQDPKRWGMVKYKTESWTHRAHFDTLGHYDRALQPGAKIYASASSGGLLPTAVRTNDGWRIVVFNRFKYPKSAEIRLPSGNWRDKAWWVVTDPKQATQTFPLDGTGGWESVNLPTYGIGTLLLGPKAMPKVGIAPEPVEPKPPVLAPVDKVYSESFAKPVLANWRAFDTNGKIETGVPGKIGFEGEDARYATQKSFGPDLSVQMKVKITQAENWEITPVLWFKEGGERFQQLKLFMGTAQLWGFDGKAYQEISDRCAISLAPGVWHDLVMQRTGDRLTMWIDGKYAWDYEGDDLPSTPGRIGLRGHGFEVGDMSIFVPKKPAVKPVRSRD